MIDRLAPTPILMKLGIYIYMYRVAEVVRDTRDQ